MGERAPLLLGHVENLLIARIAATASLTIRDRHGCEHDGVHRKILLALLAALTLLLTGCGQGGSDSPGGPADTGATAAATPAWAEGMLVVTPEQLPKEARETLRLIEDGGPYPYDKDGSVFGNFERRLPARERGYYHEYTVDTPGSRDRGARRIVTGGNGERYYTSDHYETFKAVVNDDQP